MANKLMRNKLIFIGLESVCVLIISIGVLAVIFAAVGVKVALEANDWALYLKDIITIFSIGAVCYFGGFLGALKLGKIRNNILSEVNSNGNEKRNARVLGSWSKRK